MPRPRTPLLSTERIAEAAMELVDEGEPFGVNAIARRLGVTPSSLYNHVAGRDEIVELMRGRLGEQYLPPAIEGTWDVVVEEMLRAERRMYAEHPFLIPLIVGKTITDPTVIASYDLLATALSGAGFPDDDVLEIVAILDAFSIGFGLDLASPDEIWRPETPTTTLGRLVESSPRGAPRSDRAFEAGLEMLLDGLRLRLARTELD
ncbi:AcrR family transcriptional regulator [Agromyces sp. 3263]|uniref:TetR/AcrR family transcriptional regulator n=1 Tax=Agromyces sp. 3263 TaxID=2817750 RepID=UPI0028558AEF|nr:TetR/AcrR family transcriptional regulator C-terminal domain-containing protein [Agromyces sp. 3263]MDR6905323.1 AcrR family transcriptional regulator [Agromyces sp. 3263]